jgi:prepilin-type N-terminal cleavage/methylation domain-containing protein
MAKTGGSLMLKLRKRLKSADEGFTLIEVIIAILIATVFVTVAMQIMVVAAIFKVKAQEYAEATTWIQEDLENVKYQADNLQFPKTTLTADAAAAASTITISTPTDDICNSFATNDTFRVGLETTNYKISSNGCTLPRPSTKTLTISPTLGQAQVTNAAAVATKMCSPSAQNAGLADYLRDRINSASTDSSSYNDSSKTFRTGKSFIMRKTTTISSDSPYSVLQVKYEVSEGSTFVSSKIIASFNTEVIPNVAFQCP